MTEKISGSDLYVTHEKMSTYLNQLLGGALAMVVTVIGATWFLSSQIGEVRQDVAVIKVQVSGLTKTAAIETQDVNQAQYLFVKLPPSERELEDARVRDVLIKQGYIDARNAP